MNLAIRRIEIRGPGADRAQDRALLGAAYLALTNVEPGSRAHPLAAAVAREIEERGLHHDLPKKLEALARVLQSVPAPRKAG